MLRPWPQTWAASVDGPASPLNGRGWVLQERLLAPRTLHFGREQLFWERRECRCPEHHAYHSLRAGDELWFQVGAIGKLISCFCSQGARRALIK